MSPSQKNAVILSERSESKDLGTNKLLSSYKVRRFLDSASLHSE